MRRALTFVSMLLPLAAQQPVDVACSPDALFVLGCDPARIWRLDLSTGTAGDPAVLTIARPERLGRPTRLAWAGRELLAADPQAHRVVAIDPATGAVTVVADADSVHRPGGFAAHPDGRVAFADTGNHRVLWLRRGDAGWRVEPGAAVPQRWPFDVACGADGTLYAIRNFSDVTAWSHDIESPVAVPGSALQYERFVGDRGRDRLPSRRRIAVDAAGALLLVESAHHRVRRVDPATGEVEVIAGTGVPGGSGDGGAATAAALRWPTGVTHDHAGNLFIADSGNHRVRRLDHSTGVLTSLLSVQTPRPPAVTVRGFEVVRAEPDPDVVTDAATRARLSAAGKPWCVRHRATGIELVLIPAGTYRRGDTVAPADTREDTTPAHDVTISRAFYLGRCEVSNAQYRRFDLCHTSFGNGPQELAGLTDTAAGYDDDSQPAINVSWFDAAEFCDTFGLRLPTEGEWEYAARAGATSTYPWGDELADGAAFANLAGAIHAELRESCPQPFDDGFVLTAPIGAMEANAFGLHDMIGNAWEWVADWYRTDEYARCGDGVTDPRGPLVGRARVIRGSSWRSPFAGSPRVAFRGQTLPAAHLTLARGFRVALDADRVR